MALDGTRPRATPRSGPGSCPRGSQDAVQALAGGARGRRATRVGAVPPITSHDGEGAIHGRGRAQVSRRSPAPRRARPRRRIAGRPEGHPDHGIGHLVEADARPPRPGPRASRRRGGRRGTGCRAGPGRRPRPWRSCSPRRRPRASASRSTVSVSSIPASTPSDASYTATAVEQRRLVLLEVALVRQGQALEQRQDARSAPR